MTKYFQWYLKRKGKSSASLDDWQPSYGYKLKRSTVFQTNLQLTFQLDDSCHKKKCPEN